ncbi:DUF551 domain-containing protein [Klebsiella pneumoniae]
MTKSTITRERLLEIIVTGPEASGAEQNELARIALSAMDGESECLPLDYLQGHKDGLEWASQLAEANHPETGDWLYDDPIELAKAIRKGPDMPPAQPVADSEPDRNPVLAYADSYRDMAKQGVESVPIWSVITDLERNIAPLYRHAQPAPVVPGGYVMVAASLLSELRDWAHPKIEDYCEMWAGRRDDEFPALRKVIADTDALLEAAPQSPGSEPATVPGKWIPVSERMPEAEGHYLVWANASRIDGYCDHLAIATYQGREWSNEFNWLVTHWMPLPAAPREVK